MARLTGPGDHRLLTETLALSQLWTWLLHHAVEFSQRRSGRFAVSAERDGDELTLRIKRLS